MSKAIIEKDFWVCWSRKQLFVLPSFGEHMIFKGGASLSKAYDVIHRFSEDVDLSLDRARLGFEGTEIPKTLTCPGRNTNKFFVRIATHWFYTEKIFLILITDW